MNKCPCCGSQMPGGPKVTELGFTKSELSIVEKINHSGSKGATMGNLIHELFSDKINGGPDGDTNVVRVHMHRIRKKLKPHGFEITWVSGRYIMRREAANAA